MGSFFSLQIRLFAAKCQFSLLKFHKNKQFYYSFLQFSVLFVLFFRNTDNFTENAKIAYFFFAL